MRNFQHVILGTGQATGTLLGALLPTGDSIAVIEGDRIGGTCVNTGCTPTKALVASAKVAHIVRRAPEYGVQPNGVEIDFEVVRARMNGIRDNTGMASWIRSAESVSLFEDWGRFEGPRQIRVGDESITADRIYINGGARARVPEIPGLESVPWLDNSRILELTEVPEHLIILGGSYIALEFGQIFRRFGARITVVESGSQLVFREDADVAESIKDILELEGIEFCLDSSAVRIAPDDAGVAVTIVQGGDERVLTGSHFLVAVGGGSRTRTFSMRRRPASSSTNGGSSRSTTFARPARRVSSPWVTSTDTVPSPIPRSTTPRSFSTGCAVAPGNYRTGFPSTGSSSTRRSVVSD